MGQEVENVLWPIHYELRIREEELIYLWYCEPEGESEGLAIRPPLCGHRASLLPGSHPQIYKEPELISFISFFIYWPHKYKE